MLNSPLPPGPPGEGWGAEEFNDTSTSRDLIVFGGGCSRQQRTFPHRPPHFSIGPGPDSRSNAHVAPAKRIVVIGSINIDLVCRTPRIPAPGETIIGESPF